MNGHKHEYICPCSMFDNSYPHHSPIFGKFWNESWCFMRKGGEMEKMKIEELEGWKMERSSSYLLEATNPRMQRATSLLLIKWFANSLLLQYCPYVALGHCKTITISSMLGMSIPFLVLLFLWRHYIHISSPFLVGWSKQYQRYIFYHTLSSSKTKNNHSKLDGACIGFILHYVWKWPVTYI